ncbi:hypothetical protein L202_05340 [Cryptococcus amylolentus CBS 6039]|uniref:Protein UNC80 C-terminal domain-containing protein n=1 Tax=Cryptococcus amylolentus CBS 6039 TaxID=1295533 RepID=A0A1E3HK28_9TREE|nr:hypothetical protein L202_05340 [Cryptococcus amylolentus CBS 6039]ODN76707.1 hypothetical protein L202_05340 [Cryptococcus amylolentus CBS 6039]
MPITSPPETPKHSRTPSRPVPLRSSPSASTTTSYDTRHDLRSQLSGTSLTNLDQRSESPFDALLSMEAEFMDSPTEVTPNDTPPGPSRQPSEYLPSARPQADVPPNRGRTQALQDDSLARESSQSRSKTGPEPRSKTPTFFLTRATPSVTSPNQKPKPKVSRLNTNLAHSSSRSSPTKMVVSPGIKHWQQVRAHVMAPTPVEERGSRSSKKSGLVSKAAGRFGFRHAADNVIGYNDRRRSMMGLLADLNELTEEQKEEIVRERRKFARDIKTCIDACALEESRRRLYRLGYGRDPFSDAKSSGTSIHTSAVHAHPHAAQRFTFDPSFSAFAPLLTEFHKYLPAARAKKPWSRTCPHHAEILAELGVAFLQDSLSTEGEKQQALELFGTIVKTWAADSAEEVLVRWQWLCRALCTDDRHIRNRGLDLLDNILHLDPSLPRGHEQPHTALSFHALSSDLIILLHAVESSQYPQQSHAQAVRGWIDELREGKLMKVEEASLVELVGHVDLGMVTMGGVEKELMWMAVGSVLQTHPYLAEWLLSGDNSAILQFVLPPLLHATPSYIPPIRSHTTTLLLTSFISLIRSSSDHALPSVIWNTVTSHILPQLEELPGDDPAKALGVLVFETEAHAWRADMGDADDPFGIQMQGGDGVVAHKRLIETHVVVGGKWKVPFMNAAKQVLKDTPIEVAFAMAHGFLRDEGLVPLARECVPVLLDRLASDVEPPPVARNFLASIQTHHPQVIYKPLFTLSASTSLASLTPALRTLHLISPTVLPYQQYWLTDPQMVTIVLMGDSAPRVSKGKGKEGADKGRREVRLGRWALAVELNVVLLHHQEKSNLDKRWKVFGEGLEGRLTSFLEAEEKDGDLPDGYRKLMCQLLLSLRLKTQSVRKAPWLDMILRWFVQVSKEYTPKDEDDSIVTLRGAYNTLLGQDADSGTSPSSSTSPSSTSLEERLAILDRPLKQVVASLLVVVHSSLSLDNWASLVPYLWGWLGKKRIAMRQVGFLLQKCAEIVPGQLRDAILSDLSSKEPLARRQALHSLSTLFAWRFQITAQPIMTSRRGPLFHFPTKTLEFVPTEIGSSTWESPHDILDAQLSKFGRTLPLEIRQRLFELGWSDEEGLQGKADWEQIPVSALPGLEWQQESATGALSGRPSSPMRSLARSGSNTSGHSFSSKRRKAVFAPMLVQMVYEQINVLSSEADGPVSNLSLELVRLFQRDDAAALLKPFTERLHSETLDAIELINKISDFMAPGFAYSALNALIGYTKTALKAQGQLECWEASLTTVARIVPFVSAISLRDVRKNKAEHVLLPASIHEEEGGFKIHAPWRNGQLGVQTAQLLILNETLKANPREVYLVKKMLYYLQIQESIQYLPFARAWIILTNTAFSFVNRNYNDRAELRHFLSNVGAILKMHGKTDLLITSHSMRVLMLCSARFRRVFTSMGFSTIMRPVYETYAGGDAATRDAIEYAARSFYRIHEDVFVYQACVAIAEGDYDPAAVYQLLASLSAGNLPSSGVSSGVRGLNDKEEIDALVQMTSGPEIIVSEIGKDEDERRASKLASITLDDKIFPKENIIKLFMTAIASNPSAPRAANFLRLLSALIPSIKDSVSRALLTEGVEALGSIIIKGKSGDEEAKSTFHPGAEEAGDWTRARREYVFLVESFARAGGHLGTSATRRTLDMVLDLLRKQPTSVGPAASSIVRALAETRLASSRSASFLREIAPIFRAYLDVVDFSGMLDSIVALVKRCNYELDAETTSIIVHDYVEPAIRLLASASEDSLAFIVPLRLSAVRLLSVAVFLRGDALGALERHPPSASLLASLVLPLCLMLEAPRGVDRQEVYSALWIRLLHYVIKNPQPQDARTPKASASLVRHPRLIAAEVILAVQIVKIVVIRAPSSISNVKGLWTYVSHHLLRTIQGGNARFADPLLGQTAPRVVDWLMWSVFELVSLHPNPLHIELQATIHHTLAAIDSHGHHPSGPSTPKSSTTPSQQLYSGRARRLSGMRIPSFAGHVRTPSAGGLDQTPDNKHRRTASGLSAIGQSNSPSPSHSPKMSASPLAPAGVGLGLGFGHNRQPSSSSMAEASPSGAHRPSFVEMSVRRASRPNFDAFQSSSNPSHRFPSSAGIRNLGGNAEKSGGAIIHLLGAPAQVLSATSSGLPTLTPAFAGSMNPAAVLAAQRGERALKDTAISSTALTTMANQAVQTTMLVHGWQMGFNVEEDSQDVRSWTALDALHVLSAQTKLFVEEEFRDVFSPAASEDWPDKDNDHLEKGLVGLGLEGHGISVKEAEDVGRPSFEESRRLIGERGFGVPLVSVSSSGSGHA